MRKDFVNEVARVQNVKRTDLIEKDLILHQMLLDLSKNQFFRENFAFKGGTCLAKCYLDYFRFSEDIDFTWKNPGVFEGKSQKEIRKYLSKVMNSIGEVFEEMAKKRSLDFKCLKDNRNYAELGGGNKTCTFKIWYQSEVFGRKSFLKVQMSFVEKLFFPLKSGELGSLMPEENEELTLLFPEFKEYTQKILFDVYDVREILCEKIRAILTRKGIKARDFLDVYLIHIEFGIGLEDVYDCSVEKTRFSLRLYERYRKNLEEKKTIVTSAPFTWGEEKGLLLKDINEKEFYKFLEKLKLFLKKVIDNYPEMDKRD
jgi:predicted nucleotidyltransferase component of viral defense system